MNRAMRKPVDLSTRLTSSALSRLNNYLPYFPLGTQASKFSETELVSLLEWSLPQDWRRKFDLKGYVPSQHDRQRLIVESEAIERNEGDKNSNRSDNSDNKKNNKKVKFANSGNNKKKHESKDDGRDARTDYYCKECGTNKTHATVNCYILKNRAKREQGANGDGKAHAKPFGKRTFRKEVNAMARKAASNGKLDMYAAALKREQNKQAKKAKKIAAKNPKKDESEDSESDESMNNLEAPIPRKKKSKKSIFDDLMDIEDEEEEPWSKEDKCIHDACMLEGKGGYDRKRGLVFCYQSKEEFIKNDMDDFEREALKAIQDEEKAAREAETSSPIDLSNDEEKSE
jgi:hypothetical protein